MYTSFPLTLIAKSGGHKILSNLIFNTMNLIQINKERAQVLAVHPPQWLPFLHLVNPASRIHAQPSGMSNTYISSQWELPSVSKQIKVIVKKKRPSPNQKKKTIFSLKFRHKGLLSPTKLEHNGRNSGVVRL